MKLNYNLSDNELIEKLRKGDHGAFNALFEIYGGPLFGFTLNFLKSKEETEELVQDVFLKIWENRKTLKKDTSLKCYLFTIAYHDICKLFRKKQLWGRLKEGISLTHIEWVDIEQQIDCQSILDQIEKLIAKLPPKQKIIFEKSRKEGKSTREIAEEMQLSTGTVDNHISSVTKFLRKQLSENNLILIILLLFFLIS